MCPSRFGGGGSRAFGELLEREAVLTNPDPNPSSSAPTAALTKASLACSATLETIDVLWNPSRYRIERRNVLDAPLLVGGAAAPARLSGRVERFDTSLFIDTTDRDGIERDARAIVETLVRWMGQPRRERPGAHSVVFAWGGFRFAGAIEAIDEEWIRFDPDGTPVRARLSLVLVRQE